MTLNTALIIGGDAAGAVKAAQQTTAALKGIGQAAQQTASQLTPVLNPRMPSSSSQPPAPGAAAVPPGSRQGSSNFYSANIAAQFQDIAVTSVGGGNPLQIALQQGTQLSAVFDQLKASGKSTGAALVEAFGAIVNPVSLITIGAVAAGAATIQWLMSIHGSVKTADDALKEHAALIDKIKDAYGGAEQAMALYAQQSGALFASQARQDLAQIVAQARDANTQIFSAIGNGIYGQGTSKSGGRGFTIDSQFQPFSDAIQTLRDQVRAGKPDFDAFYAAINRKVEGNSALQKAGDDLVLATHDAEQFARALKEAGTAAAITGDQVTAMINGSIAKAQGVQTDANLPFDLSAVAQSSQAAAANKIELDAINAKSPAQLADIARRRTALQLDGEEIGAALRKQKVDEAGALAYAQASHSVSEADQQRLRSATQTVSAARQDIALIGQSVGKTEQLTFARQQLAAAEEAAAQSGTMVSKAYRTEVEKLAAAYGQVQQTIAVGKLSDDLGFERAQLGRSSIDQQVASTLRPIFGDDLSSAQAQFLAGQIKINQSLSDTRDTARDLVGGVLGDLKADLLSGVGIWGAFADAGANALGKIADKALGLAADGIIDLIFNAFSGSIGGASQLHLGYNLPGFATGTSSAPGGLAWVGEKGPELVNLPRGSQVLPNDVSMNMGRGSSAPVVQIIDQRSSGRITQQRTTGPNGIDIIRAVIHDELPSAFNNARRRALILI